MPEEGKVVDLAIQPDDGVEPEKDVGEISPEEYEKVLQEKDPDDLRKQPEPEAPADPALQDTIEKAKAPDYTEGDFLREKGIEGFESIAEYKATHDTNFSKMRQLMKAAQDSGSTALGCHTG
jgi:hypothetical protein